MALTQAQRRAIAESNELRNLYILLYEIRRKISGHLRNTSSQIAAKQLAGVIDGQIRALLDGFGINSSNSASTIWDARVASRDSGTRCGPGYVWDPITETCVPQ